MNKKNQTKRNRIFGILQIVLVFIWGAELIRTDSYYVNYLLIMLFAVLSLYWNLRSGEHLLQDPSAKPARIFVIIFAALFSCMTAFSNYSIWDTLGEALEISGFVLSSFKILAAAVLLVGGFFTFWNVLHAFAAKLPSLIWTSRNDTFSPNKVFWISFVLLVITRLIVLFSSTYPGILSPDSIDQVTQLTTGIYNNQHPFFHTMVIKLCFMLGMALFHNINAAVATYTVFQILFTALCFSLVPRTMAQMKVPKWSIVLTMLFFLLMPYHILYAVTVWKDIMFACFVLLFIIFLYRSIDGTIGNAVFNFIVLTLSSIGICLFRSNGLFAFVFLTIFFFIFWKFKMKRILIMFGLVIVFSFLMKHTLMDKLNVTQADQIESLSVPAQQIARVVTEGGELNEWETETLGAVVDIERIPETYKPYISDNIKILVREKGKQELITENKEDYIKLYVSLGLKYPKAYVRAWIDLTRGYWNSGYDYWRWYNGVKQNELGLKNTVKIPVLDKLLHLYYKAFSELQVTRLFLSIGLFVWANLLMLLAALLRRDKLAAFCTLPIVFIVLSLLVATPVYSEFRYIYAAFCTLPMVLVIALRPKKKTEREETANEPVSKTQDLTETISMVE